MKRVFSLLLVLGFLFGHLHKGKHYEGQTALKLFLRLLQLYHL